MAFGEAKVRSKGVIHGQFAMALPIYDDTDKAHALHWGEIGKQLANKSTVSCDFP